MSAPSCAQRAGYRSAVHLITPRWTFNAGDLRAKPMAELLDRDRLGCLGGTVMGADRAADESVEAPSGLREPSLVSRHRREIARSSNPGFLAWIFQSWRLPNGLRSKVAVQAPATQGLITVRPAAANALASRDATTKSCDAAMAAM